MVKRQTKKPKEKTQEEPVKDEPVKDEPVKEEPVKEEPVKDETGDQEAAEQEKSKEQASLLTEEVTDQIQEILDEYGSEMTLEEATQKFKKSLKSPYAKRAIKDDDERLKYALNTVRSAIKSTRKFSSKETMLFSCMLRNVGGIVQNYANVTEETRDMKNNRDKIGIAGSWRRCVACTRMWDTADPRFGDACPACSSVNSVVLAYQAAPTGTQGILNKSEMRAGDISVFNTKRCAIFYINEDGEAAEGMMSFTGKQNDLLNALQLGIPFDINVDTEVYEHPETGQHHFSLTGTSKVTECSYDDFPDIMDIYGEMYSNIEGKSLIHSVAQAEEGGYYTFFLQVVGEVRQGKEGGKWIVNLTEPPAEPVEGEEEAEPIDLVMYLDEEDVAKQFQEDDAGIFECRYTETSMTVDGKPETVRTINVNVEACGVPIYLLGEEETRFVEV